MIPDVEELFQKKIICMKNCRVEKHNFHEYKNFGIMEFCETEKQKAKQDINVFITSVSLMNHFYSIRTTNYSLSV